MSFVNAGIKDSDDYACTGAVGFVRFDGPNPPTSLRAVLSSGIE